MFKNVILKLHLNFLTEVQAPIHKSEEWVGPRKSAYPNAFFGGNEYFRFKNYCIEHNIKKIAFLKII